MPATDLGRRIGFVATRFTGTDGVSLEGVKWMAVLEAQGHLCHRLCGECDGPTDRQRIIPEMHFLHPDVEDVYLTAFSKRKRPPGITQRIARLKDILKAELAAFVRDFGIELLVIENAVSIPLNIPLGIAITEFIAETGIPAIAHHHDLFWERKRFLVNCVWDYLNMAFPPHLPTIQHVVINSSASNQLSLRTGISPTLIPNVMDFENPAPTPDSYVLDIRRDLGVPDGGYFILQPTRIVQRKGIEHAIELVDRIDLPATLVISHASGDEGYAYESRLRNLGERFGVNIKFESEIIQRQRGTLPDGRRVYDLADAYQAADLVTYPSTMEGFGNAFLEAVYYRRPLVVNNYSIFATDIRPKGFRVIEFDGYITDETVWWTQRLLKDPVMTGEMTEHNYQLARHHYSYAVLDRQLRVLLTTLFGED